MQLLFREIGLLRFEYQCMTLQINNLLNTWLNIQMFNYSYSFGIGNYGKPYIFRMNNKFRICFAFGEIIITKKRG